MKGIGALALVYFIAVIAELRTLQFIMNTVMATGVLALVILFQPELRRMLEHVAQTKLGNLRQYISGGEKDKEWVEATTSCINVVCQAAGQLSKTKTGALMVFERDTKLGEIIKTGTVVDAAPSTEPDRQPVFRQHPAP